MGDAMRRMFYVDITMKVDGGYTPCIIIEGDAHFYPMKGNHETVQPWVWGPTIEDAKREATLANAAEFKLTTEEQNDILASVLRAIAAEEAVPLYRDGETAAMAEGITVTFLPPMHGCSELPGRGTSVYYLIRHVCEDDCDWTEDFLTSDWWTFIRRYRELNSEGLVKSVEYLSGGPINVATHPGV